MADFLSSDAPLAPFAKTTETVVPDWYTNYAKEILAGQQAIAAQPYTTYQGPRVADFTATQQQGFDAAKAAAGSYQPALTQAGGALTTAAGITPSAAATPWLQRAGQTAPQVVGEYMSPYSDAVLDRIGALGNRNFMEKLLPTISDKFVGAGGFGGTRQAEEIGRALRDTQESITAEQAKYLDSGYTGALGAAQTDLSRLAGIGQTAGALGTADVNAGVTTGGALADLAGRTQSLGLTGAGALQDVGAQQQGLNQKNLDVGYEDFLRQQGWDQQQIDNLTKTLTAVGGSGAVPKSVLESGYGPASQSSESSPSTLQTIASLVGALALK